MLIMSPTVKPHSEWLNTHRNGLCGGSSGAFVILDFVKLCVAQGAMGQLLAMPTLHTTATCTGLCSIMDLKPAGHKKHRRFLTACTQDTHPNQGQMFSCVAHLQAVAHQQGLIIVMLLGQIR